jgi:hypothetical protein
VPEAAGPGARYADPFKPEEIGAAMMDLENKTLFEKLAMEGRDHVMEQFGAEVTARKMMGVYRNLSH